MQVSWKYDNRDAVVVTDAVSYGQAFDKASDFVQAAGDEYTIPLALADGEDREDGRYEFRVKTY